MNDFTRRLGMKTVHAADGECHIEMIVDEFHMSTAERVHGGVFFTMLDTAMGRAVISNLPEGRGCATIEAKINYFRPVQNGSLRAEAHCVYVSRRTAYAEASLIDGEDRIVARSTGTFMLTDTLKQSERERV
ncbi:MAG: PaaI family thioesterase [Deltaproteobacteria bacterium]|nr:PaaI family thioesterase [Deltaproteobacteria bacterium]